MTQKTQTVNLDDIIIKAQEEWDKHSEKMKPLQKKGRDIKKRLNAAIDMKESYLAS